MNKKYRMILVLIFMGLLGISLPVQANSGPPSNLSLTITGVTEEYSLDIFIYQEGLLTQDQIDQAEAFMYRYYYQNTYPEFLKSFQDKDNYVSNTLYGSVDYFEYWDVGSDKKYVMFLNIPRTFKIVLINESDELIISKVIEMKSYDFDIVLDLSDVSFTDEITYDAGSILGLGENPFYESSYYVDMFIRLVVTILIEGLIFFAFGFRKKSTYIVFTIINVISQVGLTLGTMYSFYRGDSAYGTIFVFIFGEFLIFTGEMFLLTLLVREKKWYVRTLVVFLANIVSLVLGLAISLGLLSLIY
ncbi:MAG: hypothetical protein C4543_09575 [Ignavibacteriales bacterium]|jgi:hypothetical protein|nr:MAG: hypothetical protein C4543_09575 [Ignavibacteriales bacterium]